MLLFTEKTSRELARQIVKDANDVRVKFGRTNGEIVLHVYVPGGISRTIKTAAEWDDHPSNEPGRNKRREESENAAEELVIRNKGLST